MTRSAEQAINEAQAKLEQCERLLASSAWNNAHTSTHQGLLERLQMIPDAGLNPMRVVAHRTLKELDGVQLMLVESRLGLAKHPPLQPAIDASFGNCYLARRSLLRLATGLDVLRPLLRRQLREARENVDRGEPLSPQTTEPLREV